jgi:hypothetical protein
MKNILYRVNTNLNGLEIHEVEYTRKSDTFFWKNDGCREAINSNWVQSFETKQEAINYLQYKIEKQISHGESIVKHYTEQLNKFKSNTNDNIHSISI